MSEPTDASVSEAPSPWTSEGPVDVSRPSSRLRWSRFAFLIPVAALAFVLYQVDLPYYVIGPGPARDVQPLIQIEEQEVYPTDGRLLLTSVNLSQANVYEMLEAWLDPAKVVVPERDIIPRGQTPEEEFQIALSQMDTSKIDAAVVALSEYAGYPDDHLPGVLVESVVAGSPAAGKLFAGDLLTDIDGELLDGVDELRGVLDAARFGQDLIFTIEAGGETRSATVTLGRVEGVEGPAIGITPIDNFPFPLTIESGDIGGPSAGLMWTLGLIELLTPEDLTNGRVVAGTGVISLDGRVLPIGGVEEKVVAAEGAGATLFFVPVQNEAGARSVADDIVVVPIEDFEDAVRYLEQTA